MMSATHEKIRAKTAVGKKKSRAIALRITKANYSADDGLGAESVL
jgi:hypothetical protein